MDTVAIDHLTEQETYCLAQHYKAFCDLERQHKKASTAWACSTCQRQSQCYGKKQHPIFNNMETKLPIKVPHHIVIDLKNQ